VTVNVFKDSPGGRALDPTFATMLAEAPAALPQPSFFPPFRECEALQPTDLDGIVPREFIEVPTALAHRDVSGVPRRLPSPLQVLQSVARFTRLSNLFISVQVSPYLLSPPAKCGSKLVLYDPSHCLLDQDWGGYFMEMNPLPPFNLSVVYSGKPLGPGARMPLTDVHSIHVPSMDTQWSSLVSTFKSMNHHSPDLLFISPFVGNCMIIDRLLITGSVKPKIVYLPINPLARPPEDSRPNFFEWWRTHGEVFIMQLINGVTARGEEGTLPVTTDMWLAQCSLTGSARTLRRHGYDLLHVEHHLCHVPLATVAQAAPGHRSRAGAQWRKCGCGEWWRPGRARR